MNKRNLFHKKYEELRDSLEEEIVNLEQLHQNHLNCRSGCDMCCVDYSLLPIEFDYINYKLGLEKTPPEPDHSGAPGSCVFLKDHICTIYTHRPFICRTHGLPLIFVNESDDWELSVCELNFKTFDFGNFNLQNTLEQDRLNSKLFMLNKEYMKEIKGIVTNEPELIPVRKLMEK